MLDFMIVALPRSGTAWLANWFTTERSMCWHEALWKHEMEDLDAMRPSGLFGIADTCLILGDVDLINKHPARKLIVHRDLDEVNHSLRMADLPGTMRDEHKWKLDEIGGHHIKFEDLWNATEFRRAAEWLLPIPFDGARFTALRDLNIQNTKAVAEARELLLSVGR